MVVSCSAGNKCVATLPLTVSVKILHSCHTYVAFLLRVPHIFILDHITVTACAAIFTRFQKFRVHVLSLAITSLFQHVSYRLTHILRSSLFHSPQQRFHNNDLASTDCFAISANQLARSPTQHIEVHRQVYSRASRHHGAPPSQSSITRRILRRAW
jgi:hypothetical protein